MSALKTQVNQGSVTSFLKQVDDDEKITDCHELIKLMTKITSEKPKMWGDSIVGFGSYHYKNKSGQEGDWFLTGFSPRKQNLSLYIMAGFESYENLMSKLGKHKTGRSCLYIKKLEDVDIEVLGQLIESSVDFVKNRHK